MLEGKAAFRTLFSIMPARRASERKLPHSEFFGPLTHVIALAADIPPTMVVAADLLHKECNVQVGAFGSQGPDPRRLHGACTTAKLASANDPVRNRFAPFKLQLKGPSAGS